MYNIIKRWDNYILVKDVNNEISDTVLNDDLYEIIRQNESLWYDIVDREDEINNLYRYVWEAKDWSAQEWYKSDIDYLRTLSDTYVFSSLSTNEYIAASDDVEEFDKLCDELLDLYYSLDDNMEQNGFEFRNKWLNS